MKKIFNFAILFILFSVVVGCVQNDKEVEEIKLIIEEIKLNADEEVNYSTEQISEIPENTKTFLVLVDEPQIAEVSNYDGMDFKGKKVGETYFQIEYILEDGTSVFTEKGKIIVEENPEILQRKKDFEQYRGLQKISSSSLTDVYRFSTVEQGVVSVNAIVDSYDEYGELWIDVKDSNGNVVLHLNDFAYPDDYDWDSDMYHYEFYESATLEPGIYTIELTRSAESVGYNFDVSGLYQ